MQCPILVNPPPDLTVVVDLLYYLHMPPPPTVAVFEDYFNHLWNQTVGKSVFHHQAAHIYIVIDKPDYLPPPRALVHELRASTSLNFIEPTVSDESSIPHGKVYSSTLAKSTTFKSHLIEYVTSKFVSKAMILTKNYDFSLVIDSPSLQQLLMIQNGNVTNSTRNEHGEADYAIWHHSIQSLSQNILIISSDTDTWVYGMGILETCSRLREKNLYVQRGNEESFIHINKAVSLVTTHPILSSISYPVLSLVALYILTGCDYVSSFYRCTKTKFLETFLTKLKFVCPDGYFLKMEMGEFQNINEYSWIRLVTAVYFSNINHFLDQSQCHMFMIYYRTTWNQKKHNIWFQLLIFPLPSTPLYINGITLFSKSDTTYPKFLNYTSNTLHKITVPTLYES